MDLQNQQDDSIVVEESQEANDPAPWWYVLIGVVVGGLFPLLNRKVRSEVLQNDLDTALMAMFGGAVLGGFAAALLVIQSRIKSKGLRWLFLGLGILIVAIASCIALLMVIDQLEGR